MDKKKLERIWDEIWWESSRDARDISRAAGVELGRTCEIVREAVRIFRDHGLPVVSDGDGFQKTISPALLATCVRDLNRRAEGIRKRADGLLRRIEESWPAAAYQEIAEELFKKNGMEE